MASGGNLGLRISSILALSLGPFLVMADIISVVLVQKEFVLGLGAPGKVFPSALGIAGLVLWFAGMLFIVWAKKVRKGSYSSKASPIFLKGRKGFKCKNCKVWINASDVDYHERITCECGKNYDMFQEGPWDDEISRSEEGSSPSIAPRSPKGSDRPVKRPPRQRSR